MRLVDGSVSQYICTDGSGTFVDPTESTVTDFFFGGLRDFGTFGLLAFGTLGLWDWWTGGLWDVWTLRFWTWHFLTTQKAKGNFLTIENAKSNL